MKVGAADTSSGDLHEHFIVIQLAKVFVGDFELMRFLKKCDFHMCSELDNDMLMVF